MAVSNLKISAFCDVNITKKLPMMTAFEYFEFVKINLLSLQVKFQEVFELPPQIPLAAD